MRALDFGDFDNLKRKYPGGAELFPLPDSKLTRPALVITPHADAARADSKTAEIANAEEVGHARK